MRWTMHAFAGAFLVGLLWIGSAHAMWADVLSGGGGQRFPLIGTQYSVAMPIGFQAIYGRNGILTDHAHDASVFAWPSTASERRAIQFVNAGSAGKLALSVLGVMGKAPDYWVVDSGGARYIVMASRFAGRGTAAFQIWTTIPIATPELAIKFVQQDTDNVVLDRDVVLEAVKSLIVSKPYATKSGAYIFGLFIPAIPPFGWSAIETSGGATLSALVGGTSGYDISFRLLQQRDVENPHSLVDDQLLKGSLELGLDTIQDVVIGDTSSATFAGMNALRARATKPDKFASMAYVEYAAWSAGYGFTFLGVGRDIDMNDDIVSVIDRIARATRPETPQELLGQ